MSLIAHYPLNGDARDYFGNDGIERGSSSYIDGKIGKGLEFSGGHIDTNIQDPAGGSFSFTTWFKKTTSTWSSTGIAGTRRGNSGWMLYRNSGDSDGYFRWYSFYNSTDGSINSYRSWPGISGLQNNIWYHFCVTRTLNGFLKIYVNGVIVVTEIPPSDFESWNINGEEWSIASEKAGSSAYQGSGLALDDFRIYDHALSTKEVSEIYKSLVLLKFPEVNDNSSNSGNFITVPDSPTILGDTSIEFWINPSVSVPRRQTIWNNGYGGEGTINFEGDSGDYLRFYSGPNGGNAAGYQGVDSGTITRGVWTHAVVTRAMPSGEVKWYLNGQLDITRNYSFSTIGETTFDLTIGSGYTGQFVGKLQGVRQYATVLSAADVNSRYKTGLSIDDIGNMHANYLVDSGIINPNILDYTTWDQSSTGSAPGFGQNGSTSENFRVQDSDPFGKTVTIWEARPDSARGADGGWNGGLFPIDSTKFYRFAVWIRRTVVGNGSTYLGLNESGATVRQRSNGAVQTNPYFYVGGQNSEWTLYVGHVWPAGSGAGAVHVDTGRYTVAGGKIANINDYIWDENTTAALHRSYLYYSTNTSTRQQFVYPRVDLIDGTEPSVQALLGGFDSINYERTLELGSSSVADHPSIKYHKVNVGQFSEVGVTNNVSSFLPFNRKYTDVALGSTPVTTNPSGFASVDGHTGIDFSGVADDDARYSLTDALQLSEDWTISFFIYPRSFFNMNSYSIFINFFTYPYIAVDSGGNNLRVSLANSSGGQINYTAQGSSLSINQWALVTVVHDSANSKIKLFKNGILLSEQTSVPLQVRDLTQFNIGNYAGANYYTDGVMRNLKIFKTALTSEEVAQEYNSGKASLTKNTAYAQEFIEV